MSVQLENTEVNAAVERLLELAERMREDDFGFNELDINNIDGVIEAIHDLDNERVRIHDKLETETIHASILRHKLQFLPAEIKAEIKAAIESARQSNAEALNRHQQQLEEIKKNTVYLEERQGELDKENAKLHPEREFVKQQHEQIISQLNRRMAEKASMQITLNETRDKVRQTNQSIVDLEDGILQLKEDLIQERTEARVEKKKLKTAVDLTAEKTQDQKELNIEKKKELDALHEKLLDSEGKLEVIRKSLRRYETSKAKLEGQERALNTQLQKQLKQNEDLRRKGVSIINEDVKLQREFEDNEKQLGKKLARLKHETEREEEKSVKHHSMKLELHVDLEEKMKVRQSDADRVKDLDEELQAEKRMLALKAEEMGRMQAENVEMQEQIENLEESHKAVLAQLNKQIEDYREQLQKERKESEEDGQPIAEGKPISPPPPIAVETPSQPDSPPSQLPSPAAAPSPSMFSSPRSRAGSRPRSFVPTSVSTPPILEEGDSSQSNSPTPDSPPAENAYKQPFSKSVPPGSLVKKLPQTSMKQRPGSPFFATQPSDLSEDSPPESPDGMVVQDQKNTVHKQVEDFKLDNQRFLQDMNKKIQENKVKHVELSNEGASLQKDLRKDEGEISELNKKVDTAQAKYDNMYSDMQNKITTMEREILEFETGIVEKKKRIEEQTPIFEELEKLFEHRNNSYDDMKKGIARMRQKKSGLEEHIKRLKQEKEKLLSPKDQLQKDLKRKREENLNQMKIHGEDRQNIERQIYTAACQLKMVIEENQKLEDGCKRLKEEITELEDQMADEERVKLQLLRNLDNAKVELADGWEDDKEMQEEFDEKDQLIVDELDILLKKTDKRGEKISEIASNLQDELIMLAEFLENLATRRPRDPSEKKVFLDQIDSPIFLELVEKYAKHHMHNAVPTYTATPEQEDMAAPPQKSTAGPNASLTKKKDDAKKKKDLSDRQKKLEAAAANLELTELSAEMERTSGFEETVISSPSSTTSSLTTSTSTVTSSLVRESLQLTIPQENVVRPTFHQVTSCHTCQQLEKDVAQLNLRNHSLEVKVSQLESHLSTLWNWTSQIQQEINKNAAHSYSNQYQHQNSNGAASIDAEDASASNNATSSKEKVIAGYTMDQLEWKVSHLGSYSKTAKLLFRTLFTEEEYRNKTLTGTTKGKGAVDQDKLSVVYRKKKTATGDRHTSSKKLTRKPRDKPTRKSKSHTRVPEPALHTEDTSNSNDTKSVTATPTHTKTPVSFQFEISDFTH